MADSIDYNTMDSCTRLENQVVVIRNKHLEFVNRYPKTAVQASFLATSDALFAQFDPNHAHEVDIRHLAHCVANDIDTSIIFCSETWLQSL